MFTFAPSFPDLVFIDLEIVRYRIFINDKQSKNLFILGLKPTRKIKEI